MLEGENVSTNTDPAESTSIELPFPKPEAPVEGLQFLARPLYASIAGSLEVDPFSLLLVWKTSALLDCYRSKE
jgi:hypothetical protein